MRRTQGQEDLKGKRREEAKAAVAATPLGSVVSLADVKELLRRALDYLGLEYR